MVVYLINLFKTLSEENANWKSKSVIMLDNATYHKSIEVLKLFEKEKVQVIFTGPHSYAASPIELFFAAFKREDINPRHVPTGKG